MKNYNSMHHQFSGSDQAMRDIRSQCHRYMNYHVMGQMHDGSQFEGIIDGMDDNGVIILIAEEVDAEQMRDGNVENSMRLFGFDDDYDDYGRPRRRRFRRFRRRRFPFNFFRFIFPYPYYYPYYPY